MLVCLGRLIELSVFAKQPETPVDVWASKGHASRAEGRQRLRSGTCSWLCAKSLFLELRGQPVCPIQGRASVVHCSTVYCFTALG